MAEYYPFQKHLVPVPHPLFPQLVNKFPAFYGTIKFVTVVTNSPQLILMLGQTNQVYALSFYFLKIHFNIILVSKPRSSK
jgi:hypothetical protein